MAEKFRYTLTKEARLLFSSICAKSAPPNTGAEPKYSATFGIEKEDFDAIVQLEIAAIKSETGEFTKPEDYYLACVSGETAAKRALMKAELDARGKSPDDVFKIKEKGEVYAALYRQYAGILNASSKFEVERAKLDGGKIIDIPATEVALAQAGKDLFYRGAWAAGAVEFQGYRRKTMDAKDGVTCYLKNVMFVRNGERLGGSGAPNDKVFGGFSGYSPEDPTALAPTGENAPAGDFSSDVGGGF
jgi:hypothetical protein